MNIFPCPFCGSSLALDVASKGVRYWVCCRTVQGGCGAKGPLSTSAEIAVRKWNNERCGLCRGPAEDGLCLNKDCIASTTDDE